MNFQEQLNLLADKAAICRVENASGTAGIFRYQPLLDTDRAFWEKNPHRCYVFEIGVNCGTVFSASLVKSITMTDNEWIIKLK